MKSAAISAALSGYSIGRILLTGLKDVFQRTTFFCCTLVAEKL
jgi:hypothetical protein